MGIWYRAGTASVANGSATVTGVGTAWLVFVRPGDRITFDGGGKWYEVLAVPSNTSITLATNFAETTIVAPGGSYAIDPSSYRHQIPSDILEQLRAVLAGQTNVYSVTSLPPNDFGVDDDIAVDFVGLDLYYRAAGAWVGPVPMAYGDSYRFAFSSTVTMADPTAGFVRLNNATLASVTAIAVDSQTAAPGNPNIEAVVREWDDSTTLLHRGILTIRKRSNPAVYAIYRVSGASVENAGWTQLAVTHLASAGTFTNNDVLAVDFRRTGNAGDVSGPASSVTARIAVFSGASGKILADGGQTIAEVIAAAVSAAVSTVRAGVSSTYDTLAELAAGKVDKAGDIITGALTIAGSLSFASSLFQTGSIAPAQLTADVNDYAPPSFASASVVVLTSDFWRTLTGLAGGANGRRVVIRNGGSQPIILSSENAASAAANRFSFGSGSAVLLPGEACELRYGGEASRWHEISSVSGTRKARRLTSDTVNNNAVANTLLDLTGLAFWMEANKTYEFRIKVAFNAAATTTGSRFTVNGPASPALVAFELSSTLTATTQTIFYGAAYQQPAAASATSLASGNFATIEGVIHNGATAGLLQAQFASEIASSAITALAAGSVIEWREVA